MAIIPFPEPRWLLVRREIDGSLRPLIRCGKQLIYRNEKLARAVARPYGEEVTVIDTQAVESQDPATPEWQAWTRS